MTKHETPLIRRYWKQVGGTLVEEFPVVARSATNSQRLIDAVIMPKLPTKKVHWKEISLEGQDVIVVQAKAGRLGMYLMGQAFFSAELIKKFRPASVRSVALCIADDSVLRPLLEQYAGLEVVVMPQESVA